MKLLEEEGLMDVRMAIVMRRIARIANVIWKHFLWRGAIRTVLTVRPLLLLLIVASGMLDVRSNECVLSCVLSILPSSSWANSLKDILFLLLDDMLIFKFFLKIYTRIQEYY